LQKSRAYCGLACRILEWIWSGNASNVATFRQREPAIQQRAEDLMIGLLPPEDLEKDVGVEAERHA
jgi:hypothetical protein